MDEIAALKEDVAKMEANGGDGYKMFRGASNAYDYGPDLADVTAEFLAKQNGYQPYLDGRIEVIQ